LANFMARREEKQILLPQGGISMTCHSERSEESAFGRGHWPHCETIKSSHHKGTKTQRKGPFYQFSVSLW
jgi:hypothetical protein